MEGWRVCAGSWVTMPEVKTGAPWRNGGSLNLVLLLLFHSDYKPTGLCHSHHSGSSLFSKFLQLIQFSEHFLFKLTQNQLTITVYFCMRQCVNLPFSFHVRRWMMIFLKEGCFSFFTLPLYFLIVESIWNNIVLHCFTSNKYLLRQNTWYPQVKGGEIHFGPWFVETSIDSRLQGRAARQQDMAERTVHTMVGRKQRRVKGAGRIYASRPHPPWPPLPTRFLLPALSQLYNSQQTNPVSPTYYLVTSQKCMKLWGTISV